MDKQLENFKKHPAYQYAYNVANEKIPANIYILKVCQDFIEELDKPNSKYYFDFDLVEGITQILDCIIVPSGFKAGHSAKEVLAGFQWFFIINALCWKMSEDHEKRRYEKSIMLIARKSGKLLAQLCKKLHNMYRAKTVKTFLKEDTVLTSNYKRLLAV